MATEIVGFRVTIEQLSDDGQVIASESESQWESVALGGEELKACKPGEPGTPKLGTITLRGAMTDGRKALCDWINETVSGKPWKRNLTITELLSVDGAARDGRQIICYDGFPVSYRAEGLQKTNTTGNTMEEVRLKFVRCELK